MSWLDDFVDHTIINRVEEVISQMDTLVARHHVGVLIDG